MERCLFDHRRLASDAMAPPSTAPMNAPNGRVSKRHPTAGPAAAGGSAAVTFIARGRPRCTHGATRAIGRLEMAEAARESRDESARSEDAARRVAELTRADVANPVLARTALMWVDTVRWSRRRVPRPADETAHLCDIRAVLWLPAPDQS